ncbi:MAG: hypothetical protein ABI446_06535 [Gemmatimonadaceae bacterium]
MADQNRNPDAKQADGNSEGAAGGRTASGAGGTSDSKGTPPKAGTESHGGFTAGGGTMNKSMEKEDGEDLSGEAGSGKS